MARRETGLSSNMRQADHGIGDKSCRQMQGSKKGTVLSTKGGSRMGLGWKGRFAGDFRWGQGFGCVVGSGGGFRCGFKSFLGLLGCLLGRLVACGWQQTIDSNNIATRI